MAKTRTKAISPQPPPPPTTAVTQGSVRRALFLLAMPVLAEQMLNAFVALFDTWLAGGLGSAATSAVGLAAYVSWLASMIVMLVGTGTTALVARSTGAGEHREANRLTNQSMLLAALLGMVVLIALFGMAPWFARYTNMSGSAYGMTVRYLRTEAVGHVFMSLTIVASAALRGVGDMRTPMFVFALINLINVIASSVLVFTFHLGVNGIVGGTVIARIAGALIIVALLMRGRSGLKLNKEELRFVRDRAWRILRIGLPAAADGAIMWTGHFAFLAIIGRVASGFLGQAAFAAHIITVRVESLVYLPAVAWAAAAATMIGQSLGADDPQRAKHAGHEAVLQCGLLSVVVSVVYYLGAEWIFAQMTVDSVVRAAGIRPFRVLAMLLPLLVVSIVYVGGLRGAGDTRVPLLITLFGIVIRLSLGSYFGLVMDLGLIGAWIGMFGDMTWRAIGASWRFLGGRWLMTPV